MIWFWHAGKPRNKVSLTAAANVLTLAAKDGSYEIVPEKITKTKDLNSIWGISFKNTFIGIMNMGDTR